jgi:hypothetical protein
MPASFSTKLLENQAEILLIDYFEKAVQIKWGTASTSAKILIF